MEKPRIEGALGLAWRPRASGWAAVWLARQDIVLKGYRPSTRQISVFTSPLTEDQIVEVTGKCLDFQDDMISWSTGIGKALQKFDGSVKALVQEYLINKSSPIHKVRYHTEKQYRHFCKLIEKDHGAVMLRDLGATQFEEWYDAWRGGKAGPKVSTAHNAITMVRGLFKFATTYEIEKNADIPAEARHCHRLRAILHDLEFENSASRTETVNRHQCNEIRSAAHRRDMPSMALAQAFQFSTSMRQKDVIGEWVPVDRPGISDVIRNRKKWLRGIRWEEVDEQMILKHQMSKARKVKILEFDLKLYPMIMAEFGISLGIVPEKITRDQLPATGPIVVHGETGFPYRADDFREKWRALATSVGVPVTVRNMDSRAAAISETIAVTNGNIEAARKQAGHSDGRTTQRYSRELLESNSNVAILRAKL